jgi:hypothetical protein
MIRIAERLEFMTEQAVMASAKVGFGRKVGHKKSTYSAPISNKTTSKTKILDS